jgi:hypothetical protein
MFIETVITAKIFCDLVSVMIRALTAKAQGVGSNPAVHEKFISEEMCTVQLVATIILHFFFFHIMVKTYLNSEIYCGKNSDIYS